MRSYAPDPAIEIGLEPASLVVDAEEEVRDVVAGGVAGCRLRDVVAGMFEVGACSVAPSSELVAAGGSPLSVTGVGGGFTPLS